jgi:phenylalanyl-tRNA synthetase beta chain
MIEDQVLLRVNLLHGLLRAVQRNVHARESSIRLFEVGRVYSGAAPEESAHLAIVLSGSIEKPSWRLSSAPHADLFVLKGILEAIVGRTVSFERQNNPELALAVRVAVDDLRIGVAGQLDESAARALDATAPVLFAEIALETIVGSPSPPRRARELPRFPAMERDIALLVPVEVTHAQILALLETANEPLLTHVALFDLFTDPSGEKLPADKKSLAYSLTYRAADRTLTATEVNAAHARLKERLRSELNVVLRE